MKPVFKVWQLTRFLSCSLWAKQSARPTKHAGRRDRARSRPPRLPSRGPRRAVSEASVLEPAPSAGWKDGSGCRHGQSDRVQATCRVTGTGAHPQTPPGPTNPALRTRTPEAQRPPSPFPGPHGIRAVAEQGAGLSARRPHCVPAGAPVCRSPALARRAASDRVSAGTQCHAFCRDPGRTTGRQRRT